jgi:hypothetical protein
MAAAEANGPATRDAKEIAERIRNEASTLPELSITALIAEMPNTSVGM